jgi:hypothetical protein
MRTVTDRIPARAALAVALGVAWLNFLLTVKWAQIPGALNGWRRPWYGAALVAASVLALRPRRAHTSTRLPGIPWLIAGASALFVLVFLEVFPPASWHLLPFDDDWVPRYQSTLDGLALLRHGAIVGWQWAFLGGYHTAADLSQNLTIIGALPMAILGDRLGFHLMHFAVMAMIPWLVYLDVASDGRRDIAGLSAVFCLMCVIGMFGTIIPSGDTNSIVGVFCAMVALTGSRMARAGRPWGAAIMVGGLTLALYSHAAFFLYSVVYLALEAMLYREWRSAVRVVLASLVAVAAALPQHIEMLRYPAFFRTNNLIYGTPVYHPLAMARQVYYNVEILAFPHRWFNDYLSLTNVFLAVFLWVAIHPGRTRARFHAWIALATMVMLRFEMPEVGYLLIRETHMLAAVTAAPLAWFVIEQSGGRALAWAVVAVLVLYPSATVRPVPHVSSLRDFDPPLIDRIAALDGARVLVEFSPNRDLDASPLRRSQRSPFGVKFDAYLPAATGKLFYGQTWDTWHWSPFRGEALAAGTFRGETISDTPPEEFAAEMRKWGVKHLLVWSDAGHAYFDAAPDRFPARWRHGLWVDYEMRDADVRSVVVDGGRGSLEALGPLGGTVRLTHARRGGEVVVRTNYYPAWTASSDGRAVPLFSEAGQLAFRAPADGDYDVTLAYPRRHGLLIFAILAFIAGSLAIPRLCATPSSRSAAA